jgi:hypothetical protein
MGVRFLLASQISDDATMTRVTMTKTKNSSGVLSSVTLLREQRNGTRIYSATLKGRRVVVSIPGPECRKCGGIGCKACNYTGDALPDNKEKK